MASLKHLFSGKTHVYKSQRDLVDLSPEQILRLNPSDVSRNIANDAGGVALSGVQRRAMHNLLSRKAIEKERGRNPVATDRIIREFLIREGLLNDPEVTSLINSATGEIVRDTMDKYKKDAEVKELNNRLLNLNNKPADELTFEASMLDRLDRLDRYNKTGGVRRSKKKKNTHVKTHVKKSRGKRYKKKTHYKRHLM